MITITFSALSFLQEKLKEKTSEYYNVPTRLEEGTTVKTLIINMGLKMTDVEAAFVNGRIHPIKTVLQDGDRVALVPLGTPGPHRVLLGIYRGK